MILIADSGGSKTDWAIINKKNVIFEVSTIGLHPSVITENTWSLDIFDKYADSIEKIFFYGTGCFHNTNQQTTKRVLTTKFHNADIHILSDLMVGVHIGLNNDIGYVGIIGTGSSMAFFNGKNLKLVKESKGHTIGDPGSAICLVRACENNYSEFKRIKNKTRRCLSFLRTKINVEGSSTIVEQEFKKYFEFYKINHQTSNSDIVFIGGVANLFKDVLNVVAKEFGFNITNIIDKPISELKKYYTKLY